MTLSDLLLPDSVFVALRAASREDAVALLVDALGLPDDKARAEFRSAVLNREAAGSTGIGNGVAIPHARSTKIAVPRLAAARMLKPIDFKSADATPVALVFLLAVPAEDPRSHLAVLAALSRMALDKKLLRRLNKAASAEEFRAILAELPIQGG
ncbi:MAG: PTS sugar transporter subunit IIA [Elusimicrobiota bacterium]|jgi:mannitol/fructose-specific phosphotransferase system IIA component (Ntr-type)